MSAARTCEWTYDDVHDKWDGTCEIAWQFTEGGPEENGCKFCPRCGAEVAPLRAKNTEESE